MRPRALILAAVAACTILLLPTAALAKGASAATIEGSGPGGPGNGPNGPITLRGDGELGAGTDLGTLADLAGFFPAMFRQSPDPMLHAAPTKLLGPHYTITWTVPEGTDTARKIRQDLYPYAAGGPLTYTKPGQRIFDQRTPGGWYRASDSLRLNLISLGLPNRPALAAPNNGGSAAAPAPARPLPAASGPSDALAPWPLILGGGAVVLLVAGTVAMVLRRRPGPAGAR
jgi:hypothetical protein